MTAILDSVLRVPKKFVAKSTLAKYTVPRKYADTFQMWDEDEDDEGDYLFPVSACKDFSHFGLVDRRIEGRVLPETSSLFIPREGQMEAVDTVFERLKSSDGPDQGLLVAGCGKGKTILGTEIARRLRRPTCIMVHKEHLGDQWVEAIKMLCPKSKVGFVRQEKCDSGYDYDFVIASTQSITSTRREYPKEFYSSFGLLMLDEVHRYGADTWQKVLQKFPARLRLGLTATANRFDGLWPVITAHLGGPLYELESDPMTFRVLTVPVTTGIDRSQFEFDWMDTVMVRAKLLSILCSSVGRNSFLARNIAKAYHSDRVGMFISDRKEQSRVIQKMCLELGVPEDGMGFFFGGISKKKKEEAKQKQIIFSTYSMSEEGLNIPRLDTLFLGSPRSHIIQTVGRILREFQGKKIPVVVDPVDTDIDEAMNWAYSRLREYKSLGAVVEGHFRSDI